MSAVDEALRLRRCRELFERAAREHVSLPEARRRMAQERWRAADQRLAERQCGTEAPAFATARAVGSEAVSDETDASPAQWWQR